MMNLLPFLWVEYAVMSFNRYRETIIEQIINYSLYLNDPRASAGMDPHQLLWSQGRCVILLHCVTFLQCKFTKNLVNCTQALIWKSSALKCPVTLMFPYLLGFLSFFLLTCKNLLTEFSASLVILCTEKSFSSYVNFFQLR